MTESAPLTPAPEAASPLLTPEDAAAMLGVCGASVHRFIKQGRLPAYRVGPRLIRVRRSDVEAFLQPVRTRTSAS